MLGFRDLGASFSSFGCFVFEIWVLHASVFVFECFVFETTSFLRTVNPTAEINVTLHGKTYTNDLPLNIRKLTDILNGLLTALKSF